MRARLLKTEQDYRQALAEIERLWNAEPESEDADRLELLSLLVEAYEERVHPISPPDPIDAITFRMEQKGLSTSDLSRILGSRSRASEVLRRKRGLSLAMIRRLHTKLGIPAEVLIRDTDRGKLNDSPDVDSRA